MREPPTSEPPKTPTDDAPDDAPDETLHVSSLRPVSRTFSMRRLLNAASLVVVAILLLALAIHWLPDVLPRPKATPNPQVVHAQQTLAAIRALTHGAGWKPIGPDWAEGIAFSADGSVGYACGHFLPEPVEFFAIYHVADGSWEMFPSPLPASAAENCGVSVSPVDSADIVLTVDQCLGCAGSAVPTSLVYRSYDGGATWNALDLPPATLITDIAWTGQSTLFLVAEDTSATGTTAPPTFTLLVSRMGGPLIEIPARSLVGYDTSFGSMTLISSGVTLYASVNDTVVCSSSCALHIQSSDEGRSWTTQDYSSLAIRVINVTAAQPGTDTLIGWTFEQAALKMFIMRSDDGGVSWRALPSLPVNPGTGGAVLFIAPNGAVYAYCFGNADAVYALANGASTWRTVASLPVGFPITVQYNSAGHAVALWAGANDPRGSPTVLGLAYFLLPGSAP